MAYPRILVDLDKLEQNVNRAADLCHLRGQTFAAVTKCVCGERHIVDRLRRTRCDWLADSRIENLIAMGPGEKPRLLLRAAQPWETDRVVAGCEYSMVSEPVTIALLAQSARRLGIRHRVLLACDMGDLREGCFFRDEAAVFSVAEAVLAEPSLELAGVATNLGCYGGIRPCQTNLGGLAAIADVLRRRYDIALPVVSGGTSCTLRHLLTNLVPEGVNHFRMGECWLTGRDSATGTAQPGFYEDAFTLEAQLIEVKTKPSRPIGPRGGDAFGHLVDYPDRGPMLRGICAVGKQDIDMEAIVPQDARVEILGGSSDHMLLNLNDAPEYRVGDIVRFTLRYGSILRSFTGPYLEKCFPEADS